MMLSAAALKEAFPWLGTDEDVSGADVVDRLNDLYQRLSLSTGVIQDGTLHCPVCYRTEGLRYLEDISNHRKVEAVLDDDLLLINSHYDTENTDDGVNPRIVCPCGEQFLIPLGLECKFV